MHYNPCGLFRQTHITHTFSPLSPSRIQILSVAVCSRLHAYHLDLLPSSRLWREEIKRFQVFLNRFKPAVTSWSSMWLSPVGSGEHCVLYVKQSKEQNLKDRPLTSQVS